MGRLEPVPAERGNVGAKDPRYLNSECDPAVQSITCSFCGDMLANRGDHGRLYMVGANTLYRDTSTSGLLIECCWCGRLAAVPPHPGRRRSGRWLTWRHPEIEDRQR